MKFHQQYNIIATCLALSTTKASTTSSTNGSGNGNTGTGGGATPNNNIYPSYAHSSSNVNNIGGSHNNIINGHHQYGHGRFASPSDTDDGDSDTDIDISSDVDSGDSDDSDEYVDDIHDADVDSDDEEEPMVIEVDDDDDDVDDIDISEDSDDENDIDDMAKLQETKTSQRAGPGPGTGAGREPPNSRNEEPSLSNGSMNSGNGHENGNGNGSDGANSSSSQPLQTLKKLQAMLEDTDYATATSSNASNAKTNSNYNTNSSNTRRSGSGSNENRRSKDSGATSKHSNQNVTTNGNGNGNGPDIMLSQAASAVISSSTNPIMESEQEDIGRRGSSGSGVPLYEQQQNQQQQQQENEEQDKLWTSKDRSKYKKRQRRLQREKEQQRLFIEQQQRQAQAQVQHSHSSLLDDDGTDGTDGTGTDTGTDMTDDSDDGLGYVLPNLPVYFSDAESADESSFDSDSATSTGNGNNGIYSPPITPGPSITPTNLQPQPQSQPQPLQPIRQNQNQNQNMPRSFNGQNQRIPSQQQTPPQQQGQGHPYYYQNTMQQQQLQQQQAHAQAQAHGNTQNNPQQQQQLQQQYQQIQGPGPQPGPQQGQYQYPPQGAGPGPNPYNNYPYPPNPYMYGQHPNAMGYNNNNMNPQQYLHGHQPHQYQGGQGGWAGTASGYGGTYPQPQQYYQQQLHQGPARSSFVPQLYALPPPALKSDTKRPSSILGTKTNTNAKMDTITPTAIGNNYKVTVEQAPAVVASNSSTQRRGLTFDSIQKLSFFFMGQFLMCYCSVSPRNLELVAYNAAFRKNMRIVLTGFVFPTILSLSVINSKFCDLNKLISTFYISATLGYSLSFMVEIFVTGLIRLGVFWIWEPSIFALTPTVPLIILPFTVREHNYRPKRITLFVADFVATCVAAPIIEEYVKLKVVQLSTQLPRNFRRVKKIDTRKKHKKKKRGKKHKYKHVMEPIELAPGEEPVTNINKYASHMLAASLGMKMSDTTRRVLMYTKQGDEHKHFYALFRGFFPIHELCGAMTALELAKRDVLGLNIPLWRMLLPAVFIHGIANLKGMKPAFKWNGTAPWSEIQMSPWYVADYSNLAQLAARALPKLMWLIIIGRVSGYCIKNYYMVGRKAVKRSTTFAGNKAAFNAEIEAAEVLKRLKKENKL